MDVILGVPPHEQLDDRLLDILAARGACADGVKQARKWLGGRTLPLCERTEITARHYLGDNLVGGAIVLMCYGDGSGDGYGDGDGSGSGSGDGYGYGYGYGDGYGSGSGDGYGDGDGSGSGYGDGYGDGDTAVAEID